MKKTVFLYLFFCVSVLYCLAQEKEQTDENDNTLPLFSYSGLSTQTFGFGLSTMNPILGTDSLAWRQVDLGLTKYSDYGRSSFTEVVNVPLVLGLGLAIGGIVMGAFGIGSPNNDVTLGLVLGGVFSFAIGMPVLILLGFNVL